MSLPNLLRVLIYLDIYPYGSHPIILIVLVALLCTVIFKYFFNYCWSFFFSQYHNTKISFPCSNGLFRTYYSVCRARVDFFPHKNASPYFFYFEFHLPFPEPSQSIMWSLQSVLHCHFWCDFFLGAPVGLTGVLPPRWRLIILSRLFPISQGFFHHARTFGLNLWLVSLEPLVRNGVDACTCWLPSENTTTGWFMSFT